jgi:hypothetical protein
MHAVMTKVVRYRPEHSQPERGVAPSKPGAATRGIDLQDAHGARISSRVQEIIERIAQRVLAIRKHGAVATVASAAHRERPPGRKGNSGRECSDVRFEHVRCYVFGCSLRSGCLIKTPPNEHPDEPHERPCSSYGDRPSVTALADTVLRLELFTEVGKVSPAAKP